MPKIDCYVNYSKYRKIFQFPWTVYTIYICKFYTHWNIILFFFFHAIFYFIIIHRLEEKTSSPKRINTHFYYVVLFFFTKCTNAKKIRKNLNFFWCLDQVILFFFLRVGERRRRPLINFVKNLNFQTFVVARITVSIMTKGIEMSRYLYSSGS